jgi:hypothetical protein
MPVHEYLGDVDHVERPPCCAIGLPGPSSRTGGRLPLLDSQVHHDTQTLPLGNCVSEVGNYVCGSLSHLGNYVSDDTSGHTTPPVRGSEEPAEMIHDTVR